MDSSDRRPFVTADPRRAGRHDGENQMSKLLLATAALLALAACEGVYGPNDPRVVGAVSPVCETFPQLKGCEAPPGTEIIGGLIVVPR